MRICGEAWAVWLIASGCVPANMEPEIVPLGGAGCKPGWGEPVEARMQSAGIVQQDEG